MLMAVLQGKPSTEDIVDYHYNKCRHFKYSYKMNFISHPEIENMEEEVEIRYNDRRKPSRKYSCLNHFYMSLCNLDTGKLLIEGTNLNSNKPGPVQIMLLNTGNNITNLNRIQEYPTAWWW